MSAVKRGSYPHPVLDWSDDVASEFEVFNVTVSPTVDDVELKFQIRMNDADIQKLLDSGAARLSFRWKCGSTLSSQELAPQLVATYAESKGYAAWIDQQLIRRSVRVEIKIVAADQIDGYRLERQHADYGDATFDLARGDVIADAGSFIFEADKLYDPLNPPIGSCFRFRADKTLKRGIRINWDDDEYVEVRFPVEALAGFGSLGARPDLQVSLVVLPALMATIEFIKANSDESGEDLSDRLWYLAIVGLIETHGSLDDQTFDLAQKILSYPLNLSLSNSLNQPEDDDE